MELILLIGIQASGKSTFFKRRYCDTHVRINLDMLKTRHREEFGIATAHPAGGKQSHARDERDRAGEQVRPGVAPTQAVSVERACQQKGREQREHRRRQHVGNGKARQIEDRSRNQKRGQHRDEQDRNRHENIHRSLLESRRLRWQQSSSPS